MSLLKNILVATGLGGGVILFLLERYNRVSKDIQVIPSFSISGFGLKGMTLDISLAIKNPTSVKLNIMFPFMRLMMGSSILGSSQVINQVITIPAYGEAQINKIGIPITLMEEIDLGLTLFSPLASGQSVGAEIVTTSALVFWFGEVPFERVNSVTLKKG